ncbi:hypothetical protein GCM10011514_15680 [Emticicia aquatilis]|uniref:DUF2568 domain-containing protein n=1 Tax=Emticicia aquatilis TaxID=1537369 RepID=A0A916YNY3_9BACT|nr:YrdB family protein [Emticicia aquatilis]GGD52326.1 hypothetical protein GCM10011514_15680 [Emticicia aquatilis]
MSQIILSANAALAFILELIMFYSVGSYGFSIGKTSITKWLFAIGFALIAIALWAIWAAPKSEHRLSSPARYIFEWLMFMAGSFCFFKLNHINWAVGTAILATISVFIAYSSEQ